MNSYQKEKLFYDFQPMIERFVWGAKKRLPFLDIDDLRGQAYLIFAETCERFVPGRASFGTFLFHRLRSLSNFIYLSRLTQKEEELEEVEKEDDPNLSIILDASLSCLSKDAGEVLFYLVNRDWETVGVGRKNPSYRNMQKAFKLFKDWGYSRFNRSWEELRKWYQENYYLV